MKGIGEIVHERLLAEGGFCCGPFGGRVWIDWNWKDRSKGEKYQPSAELKRMIVEYRAELKAYVIERQGLGGVGSSSDLERQHRTREGAGVCECNGANGAGYARLAGSRRSGSGMRVCFDVNESPKMEWVNVAGSGFFAVCAPAAREGGEGK